MAGHFVTEQETVVYELDVCRAEACGFLVGADGDSTGCPYCGARCERIPVIEVREAEQLVWKMGQQLAEQASAVEELVEALKEIGLTADPYHRNLARKALAAFGKMESQ